MIATANVATNMRQVVPVPSGQPKRAERFKTAMAIMPPAKKMSMIAPMKANNPMPARQQVSSMATKEYLCVVSLDMCRARARNLRHRDGTNADDGKVTL